MQGYDEAVVKCFLEKQEQMFPEPVADSYEEAEAFLEECMAIVVNSKKEVWDSFDEECIDMEGADEDEILEAAEVFDVGDGRYLIVE